MPCPAIPTCPRWTGCIGTSRDGSQYQMRCGIDFNGNIISTTQVSIFPLYQHTLISKHQFQGRVFTDCADACAANPSCKAYNMKDNFCYLLGDVTGTPRNSYVSPNQEGPILSPCNTNHINTQYHRPRRHPSQSRAAPPHRRRQLRLHRRLPL
jgi:hypothetical protein